MQPNYDMTLEDQLRECFGRVVYTHKTHERMADNCAAVRGRWILFQIIITTITSTSAVAVFLTDQKWLEIATILLSGSTLFTTLFLKDFVLGSTIQKHRDVASRLWNVREAYLSLITDLPHMNYEDAIGRRDELQIVLAGLYEASPQTNNKAYKEAQKRLKKKEDLTFSEEEIDCFLPYSLKRAGGRPNKLIDKSD